MIERDPVIDVEFMERCLLLAVQAEGRTAPNPVVGAVVVDAEGTVVGEGYHQRAGEPHAEVFALDAAGERARGGTLYVTLEPCCHHGKTPPCSERVIASGVTRVVVGTEDPNPKVGGGGIAALREQGITVDVGVMEEECLWSNRAFISRIKRKRPWVSLKIAASLDGRIADRFNKSRWISSALSQEYVQKLRNTYDCILIGAATAREDDPELTVRIVEGGRNPSRAVIDPSLSLSPSARIFTDHKDRSRVFAFAAEEEAASKRHAFADHINIVPLQKSDGHLDLQSVLEHLCNNGINSVLCEGGGKLAGQLLAAKLVDEVHWIIAPKLFSDSNAVPAAAADNPVKLVDVPTLKNVRVKQLGNDVLIVGTF